MTSYWDEGLDPAEVQILVQVWKLKMLNLCLTYNYLVRMADLSVKTQFTIVQFWELELKLDHHWELELKLDKKPSIHFRISPGSATESFTQHHGKPFPVR